jgi:hypothetical protein
MNTPIGMVPPQEILDQAYDNKLAQQRMKAESKMVALQREQRDRRERLAKRPFKIRMSYKQMREAQR